MVRTRKRGDVNGSDKRKLNELVRRWHAVATAHDQYTTVDVVQVYARAKRDAYRACANELEAAFGLAPKATGGKK